MVAPGPMPVSGSQGPRETAPRPRSAADRHRPPRPGPRPPPRPPPRPRPTRRPGRRTSCCPLGGPGAAGAEAARPAEEAGRREAARPPEAAACPAQEAGGGEAAGPAEAAGAGAAARADPRAAPGDTARPPQVPDRLGLEQAAAAASKLAEAQEREEQALASDTTMPILFWGFLGAGVLLVGVLLTVLITSLVGNDEPAGPDTAREGPATGPEPGPRRPPSVPTSRPCRLRLSTTRVAAIRRA